MSRAEWAMSVAIAILTPAAGVGLAATGATALPEKAVCCVCAAHGESAPEKVAAAVEHEGATYYFCATGCRDAFVADPAAYAPQPLPRPAPAFTVRGLDGGEVSLSAYAGRVVLLDFWATWCKPCARAMPKLQRLHERHAEAGLVVMGVAIDALPEGAREDDRPAKIAKFARRHEVDYPLFLDSADAPAWAAWRVKAVPALFLIDRQGQVVAQWTGEPDQDDVARAVAATLAGSDGQVAP